MIISCTSDDTISITDQESIDSSTPIDTIDPNEPSINIANYDTNFAEGSFNSFFNNALISDVYNNIERGNPIIITEYDEVNKRIKTNYIKKDDLLVKATSNQSWFITQNSEASTVVEIINIDATQGWITFGQTYSGTFNTAIGAKIEFFNPFVNYQIIG